MTPLTQKLTLIKARCERIIGAYGDQTTEHRIARSLLTAIAALETESETHEKVGHPLNPPNKALAALQSIADNFDL